jgi:nicotinamidase-related amidase
VLLERDLAVSVPGSLSERPLLTLLQLGGAPRPRLVASRAALIIIDAQREYAEGPVMVDGLDAAMKEIGRLRSWAKGARVPVIHVRHEGRSGAPLFGAGSMGADFLPGCVPAAGEVVVTKRLPNSFAQTDLQTVLKQAGRDHLVLAGFMTHMCVDTTARAALDLGYQTAIVAAATADRRLPDLHGVPIPSSLVARSSLAALADRFATVLEDTAALVSLIDLPENPCRGGSQWLPG